MADTRYTSISCKLWEWEPWISLESSDAQLLWLALYSSGDAKSSVPGLWRGNIATMADVMRRSQNAAWNALDILVHNKLAEFDQKYRLARLLKLPDAGERAHNDKAIWGWWSRFTALPEVPTRDAHVPLLYWLVQSGKCTEVMSKAWTQTFGTIVVPASRPQLPAPSSCDTGVGRQVGLWSDRSDILEEPKEIRDAGPPAVVHLDHQRTTGSGTGSGSGSGSGTGDPEGESVRGGPHLQLVRSPTPEEFAAIERAKHAAELRAAVIEAGGSHLLGGEA